MPKFEHINQQNTRDKNDEYRPGNRKDQEKIQVEGTSTRTAANKTKHDPMPSDNSNTENTNSDQSGACKAPAVRAHIKPTHNGSLRTRWTKPLEKNSSSLGHDNTESRMFFEVKDVEKFQENLSGKYAHTAPTNGQSPRHHKSISHTQEAKSTSMIALESSHPSHHKPTKPVRATAQRSEDKTNRSTLEQKPCRKSVSVRPTQSTSRQKISTEGEPVRAKDNQSPKSSKCCFFGKIKSTVMSIFGAQSSSDAATKENDKSKIVDSHRSNSSSLNDKYQNRSSRHHSSGRNNSNHSNSGSRPRRP